jgi:hypothetical protein
MHFCVFGYSKTVAQLEFKSSGSLLDRYAASSHNCWSQPSNLFFENAPSLECSPFRLGLSLFELAKFGTGSFGLFIACKDNTKVYKKKMVLKCFLRIVVSNMNTKILNQLALLAKAYSSSIKCKDSNAVKMKKKAMGLLQSPRFKKSACRNDSDITESMATIFTELTPLMTAIHLLSSDKEHQHGKVVEVLGTIKKLVQTETSTPMSGKVCDLIDQVSNSWATERDRVCQSKLTAYCNRTKNPPKAAKIRKMLSNQGDARAQHQPSTRITTPNVTRTLTEHSNPHQPEISLQQIQQQLAYRQKDAQIERGINRGSKALPLYGNYDPSQEEHVL